jgi:hypothetical protein
VQGPESRHAWLINEAVEAPLQFPKNREMIFQLREALIATAEENHVDGGAGTAFHAPHLGPRGIWRAPGLRAGLRDLRFKCDYAQCGM